MKISRTSTLIRDKTITGRKVEEVTINPARFESLKFSALNFRLSFSDRCSKFFRSSLRGNYENIILKEFLGRSEGRKIKGEKNKNK